MTPCLSCAHSLTPTGGITVGTDRFCDLECWSRWDPNEVETARVQWAEPGGPMTAARKFRKKPVEIQAVQWTGDNAEEIKAFVGYKDTGECRFLTPDEFPGDWTLPHVWDELHATWVGVNDRDWIIKGIQGEFYPCRVDVFAATYEPAGEATAW